MTFEEIRTFRKEKAKAFSDFEKSRLPFANTMMGDIIFYMFFKKRNTLRERWPFDEDSLHDIYNVFNHSFA